MTFILTWAFVLILSLLALFANNNKRTKKATTITPSKHELSIVENMNKIDDSKQHIFDKNNKYIRNETVQEIYKAYNTK